MAKLTGYELSRQIFDYSFENPSKISPNHIAIYLFAIEHCNRLGWKKEFGFPTTYVMEAVGIKSYNTYKKCFDELSKMGFFKVIEKSKNQYSSNIIALSKFDKALDKALDKAMMNHLIKQGESTIQSNDSINKPQTSKHTNKENVYNGILKKETFKPPSKEEFIQLGLEKRKGVSKESLALKYDSQVEQGWINGNGEHITNWRSWLMASLAYLPLEKKEEQKPFIRTYKEYKG